MDFKNGVINIQAAGYNGARTVVEHIHMFYIGLRFSFQGFLKHLLTCL